MAKAREEPNTAVSAVSGVIVCQACGKVQTLKGDEPKVFLCERCKEWNGAALTFFEGMGLSEILAFPAADYKQFAQTLDKPPEATPALKKLMASKPPWET